MTGGDVTRPGIEATDRRERAGTGGPHIVDVRGNHQVDRFTDDRRDRDAAPPGFRPEAPHLVFGQRDLRPDHEFDVITWALCDINWLVLRVTPRPYRAITRVDAGNDMP